MEWSSFNHLKDDLSPDISYWLFDVKKLGNELKTHNSKYDISLHSQEEIDLSIEDIEIIRSYKEITGMSRLISHHLQGTDIVVCRTIIPNSTYLKFQDFFDNLGNGSIGNLFLYKKIDVERSEFSAKLMEPDEVYEKIKYNINHPVWVRRSVFTISGTYKLFIEEYFTDITLLLNYKLKK